MPEFKVGDRTLEIDEDGRRLAIAFHGNVVDLLETAVEKGIAIDLLQKTDYEVVLLDVQEEALERAGPLRLRPILMTALTTIAAVTPIALALSEGGEQRAPMGVAVIGGMLTSTFLTLLVIPCVYTVMDDVGNWASRGLRLIGIGSSEIVSQGVTD